MVKKKKTIPSYMTRDIGVEDLINGNITRPVNSLKDFDVLNKLGILSPLKDRHNTDPTNFALESAILLGESESFGVFATQQLREINDRFALCNTIKKKYALEGFDPFKVGMEDVGDSFKKVGTAIIAAFKKLGAMIMNFIRSVANTVKSGAALAQVKLYEKSKGTTFSGGVGKELKCLVPTKNPVDILEEIKKDISNFVPKVKEISTKIDELINVRDAGNSNLIDKSGGSTFENFVKEHDGTVTEKKGAKEIVYTKFFGSEKPAIQTMKAGDYIKKCNGIEILSKVSLDKASACTAHSKVILKEVNFSLKQTDRILVMLRNSQKESFSDKEGSKHNKAVVKQIRQAFNASNLKRQYVTKMQSIILIGFSTFLKCRGYMAAAVKLYGAKEKEPKEKKSKK